MRIDHHAYQRATRVASFGLLLQIILGVALLVFGILGNDTALQFASVYILSGVLVWVGLIIIFYQHKLERLEALEEDELAATRGGASTSFFDSEANESRVAARRLALMHKWLMPGLSILLALALGGFATLMLRFMQRINSTDPQVSQNIRFQLTDELGWAVALALGFAVASFIFSRFIAGMAKQSVWQNLRGGASYMVGNALVLAAVAAGIIFRFFQNDSVIEGVGWGIPIFMGLQVLEILLNFILNLYRPRIPGEVPRPAFDSRVLSWFASPDSIVRSLNEAVNYQFGFDVTSSWGYQLLLRSFVWLLAIGIGAMVLLNTMVVIEPHQQAVRLRGGAIVLDDQGRERVYSSGIMWKRPWPLETAAVYDVTRVQNLYLTNRRRSAKPVIQWTDDIDQAEVEPFIVGSSAMARTLPTTIPATPSGAATTQPEISEADSRISNYYALVDAEVVLKYRIKPDNNGLIEFLNFAPETAARGKGLSDRERVLRDIALGQVSTHLARLSLDEVLSPGLTDLTGDLSRNIQAAFDAHHAGVEIVSVDLPLLRPHDFSAGSFEELGISRQASKQSVAYMERNQSVTNTYWIGEERLVAPVIAALRELDALRSATAVNPGNARLIVAKKLEIEGLLRQGGGQAAHLLAEAERDRWVSLMNVRAKASEILGQLGPYRAAPELYRHRQIMDMYKKVLPHLHKIIVGIDPARMNVHVDLQETNPLLDAGSMINPESK